MRPSGQMSPISLSVPGGAAPPSSTPDLVSTVLETTPSDGDVRSLRSHRGSRAVGFTFPVSGHGDAMSHHPSRRAAGFFPVEQSIYDTSGRDNMDRAHVNKTGLIKIDSEEEQPTYDVYRCFTDVRVLVMDIVMLISVILTSFTAPLTFIWGGDWNNLSPIPWGVRLLAADATLDAVYSFHLIMRLRTSYLSSQRLEVVSQAKILRAHLKNPIYWVLWLGATTHIWTALGAPMLLSLLKVVRIMRHLCFYPDSLWRLKENSVIRLASPILLLVIASHWVACLLSTLGGYQYQAIELGRAAMYETTFKGSSVSPWLSIYLMAFVEAIYLLTGSLDNPLGEGDSIRRQMFGSLAIVAVFGPLGCVVVSLFISALVREQALRFCLDIKHSENKAYMLRAMQNFNIPDELQKRVLCLHEFQKMSFDREAFDILFSKNNLSPPLDLALRVYVYHDSALKNSPYLMHKEPNYILDIISSFEDRIYLPNDYVIRRGQLGTGMYFMIRGEVSVLVPDPSQTGVRSAAKTHEVAKKFKGDHFGEVALIMDCVRTAWVRSNIYVLAAMLTRANAEAIWKYFPKERELLLHEVIETARTDRARANAGRISEDSAFMDGDSFRRLAATNPPLDQTPASGALVTAAAKHLPWSEGDVGSVEPLSAAQMPESDVLAESALYATLQQVRQQLAEQGFEARLAAAEQREQFAKLRDRQEDLEARMKEGFAAIAAATTAMEPLQGEVSPNGRRWGRSGTAMSAVVVPVPPSTPARARVVSAVSLGRGNGRRRTKSASAAERWGRQGSDPNLDRE